MMVVAFIMKIKNKFRESKFNREQQDAERELYFRVKREADRIRRSREGSVYAKMEAVSTPMNGCALGMASIGSCNRR
jgi:hypothetical protein